MQAHLAKTQILSASRLKIVNPIQPFARKERKNPSGYHSRVGFVAPARQQFAVGRADFALEYVSVLV